MRTSNQPAASSNSEDRDAAIQITFTPYTYNGKRWVRIEKPWTYGVWHSAISEDCEGSKARYIDLAAELDGEDRYVLAIVLAKLTSAQKDGRAWAKQWVRDMAAAGKAVFDAARAVLDGYTVEPE